MKANALALALAATALGLPLVLTSSLEDQQQGPLQPEFAEIAPMIYAARIQGVGVGVAAVNAMDAPNFAAAAAAATATGRRSLIMSAPSSRPSLPWSRVTGSKSSPTPAAQ